MNSKLNLIARQVNRREQQAPAPAPEVSGVGSAIEAMIEQAVNERVQAQLAEQKRMLEAQQPKSQYTDYRQLPPLPQARAPKAVETQLMRDELGRVNKITVGTMEFYVQRNPRGQAVRVVPADTAPLPPAVPPADINRGA
ncbi:hypothetical protein [Pseudomonas sp. H9]|uniref:hypothetical protein n=1 Tax=Pseudomonas sp. H9 TaxID=483968 RepID=UPI0010582309|nr:hypothetical protein [Pseudomonas sp. H9]TDF77708.1 hypothetical protein E1573_26530 [Pseudomonas sp. H9]